jgi:BirA family biotin operon repressor/biotin-[acetyl-CoA-carboxylase] ligase
VSGAELAALLGVSRTAVWKQIKSLERAGFVIEAVPSKGYRLTASPDIIHVDEVARMRAAGIIGRTIVYRTETVSTNTLAMELAQQGASEGTVVAAETQTGGKGRLGRTWISPRGDLAFSVILRPALPAHKAPLITLMGAVAVAAAIRGMTGIAAGIKWPNDILIVGKKACGLLTELSAEQDRIRHVVLGVGVNVNSDRASFPADVRERSASLSATAGAPLDRTKLLAEILAGLDHAYQRFLADGQSVLVAWREMNVTLGRRVAVSGPDGTFEGNALDIDEEGRLVVRPDEGAPRTVAAGDVTIIKKD